MLTQARVTELFMEYLPDRVTVTVQDLVPYIQDALHNGFVRAQLAMGIYDLSNIRTDFLGIAKSLVLFGEVVVCLDLLNNHLQGLPIELQEGYVRHTAAHEAHHFEHGHGFAASTPLEQAHREQDCNDLIARRYPELERIAQQVEQQSPTFQRVFERIRCIQEAS